MVVSWPFSRISWGSSTPSSSGLRRIIFTVAVPGKTSKTELSRARAAFSSIITLVFPYTNDRTAAETMAITDSTTTMRTDSFTCFHPLPVDAGARPPIEQRSYGIHEQNGEGNSLGIATPQSNHHDNYTDAYAKDPAAGLGHRRSDHIGGHIHSTKEHTARQQMEDGILPGQEGKDGHRGTDTHRDAVIDNPFVKEVDPAQQNG